METGREQLCLYTWHVHRELCKYTQPSSKARTEIPGGPHHPGVAARGRSANSYELGSWTTMFQSDFSSQSVQSLSHIRLFVTPWTAARQASLSITNSRNLLKFMSIEWWCHPTISSSVIPFSSHLQSFPALGSFQMTQVLHIRWPKYWSFSSSISPSNDYSVLISFRMDRLDLLAVQGTLKGLLQHHSPKASILWCSAFFTVQLSHPFMTTGKTIALIKMDLCWQSNVSAFQYAV